MDLSNPNQHVSYTCKPSSLGLHMPFVVTDRANFVNSSLITYPLFRTSSSLSGNREGFSEVPLVLKGKDRFLQAACE